MKFMQNNPNTYKDAGVDTEEGVRFVGTIKNKVQSTFSPQVLGGLGGFAAAYDVSFLKDYKQPILLSSTDGVGTKLEIARLLDIHNTIGIDLVAMCVNDLLVMGGKPLFFLDYISCGKLYTEKMAQIIEGIIEGCKQAGASLVGGETAEHPGLMKLDEYDLAGFTVGVVEKEDIIDGSKVQAGDVVIGLESSGPHSNGFSLIRKLYLKDSELPTKQSEIDFIVDHLFKPTRIYVKTILGLLKDVTVHGMVHVTGGGFYENIPRVLNPSISVKIFKDQLPTIYVFDKIQNDNQIETKEMFSVFNMGIGYIILVSSEQANKAIEKLKILGENPRVIGEVVHHSDESEQVKIY